MSNFIDITEACRIREAIATTANNFASVNGMKVRKSIVKYSSWGGDYATVTIEFKLDNTSDPNKNKKNKNIVKQLAKLGINENVLGQVMKFKPTWGSEFLAELVGISRSMRTPIIVRSLPSMEIRCLTTKTFIDGYNEFKAQQNAVHTP